MLNMKFIVLAFMAVLFVQCISGQRVRSLRRHCVDSGFAGVCASSNDPTKRGFCSGTISCAVRVGRRTYKQSYGRPPENHPCGNLKVCRNRKCVTVERNPTVVGETTGSACGSLVSTANRITPRDPPPLSP